MWEDATRRRRGAACTRARRSAGTVDRTLPRRAASTHRSNSMQPVRDVTRRGGGGPSPSAPASAAPLSSSRCVLLTLRLVGGHGGQRGLWARSVHFTPGRRRPPCTRKQCPSPARQRSPPPHLNSSLCSLSSLLRVLTCGAARWGGHWAANPCVLPRGCCWRRPAADEPRAPDRPGRATAVPVQDARARAPTCSNSSATRAVVPASALTRGYSMMRSPMAGGRGEGLGAQGVCRGRSRRAAATRKQRAQPGRALVPGALTARAVLQQAHAADVVADQRGRVAARLAERGGWGGFGCRAPRGACAGARRARLRANPAVAAMHAPPADPVPHPGGPTAGSMRYRGDAYTSSATHDARYLAK